MFPNLFSATLSVCQSVSIRQPQELIRRSQVYCTPRIPHLS